MLGSDSQRRVGERFSHSQPQPWTVSYEGKLSFATSLNPWTVSCEGKLSLCYQPRPLDGCPMFAEG